ncbi:hypothetical protein H4R21_004532 [Coemansia helicoidea]|uniref:Uncharacterized protein n=1 Tax=Coemansia helicoidea TaxID=1286919 RepID=A0ACC1KYE4_9FUNG|nr:hypothetical protein H4R21_004532 [Coemansia helicoidea]
MNLNRYIDQSLDQIIADGRKQKQAQKAKRAAPAAAEMAKRPKRSTKNKPSAAGPGGKAADALSGRLGRNTDIAKVIGKGRLAGRVGKASVGKASTSRAAPGKTGPSTTRLAGLAERLKGPPKAAKVDRTIVIKGEAGPASVFISNLDTEASTEDVRTCFKQFGAIKGCTLLYDSNGRATGHAEVTYAAKAAAEEAVAKLNNALADGRRLAVKIMPASKQAAPNVAPFAAASAPQMSTLARKNNRRPRKVGGGRMEID